MSNEKMIGGFTLVELLVTISVAAILTAVAVPAFDTFVKNDRDAAQINSLVLSFTYARSEAIKRNLAGGVTVCPSADAMTCSGTSAWSNGWIVIDSVGDPPFQTVPALAGINTLGATGASTGVTFLSSGLVVAPIAIKVCDPRGANYARDVEVNATGRVAASQTPGQTVAGAALTCP